MKIAPSILLALLLAGCTSTTYRETKDGAEFTRRTLLTNQQIGDLTLKAGEKQVTLGSYTNSQAEATGALLGAALKAAQK